MRRRRFGKEEDLPLFDESKYPIRPGFKESSTSKDAAREIHLAAHTLRAMAYSALYRRQMTADEVAGVLKQSRLAIRPRLSELRFGAFIQPSGKYRQNRSGRRAIVWKVIRAPAKKKKRKKKEKDVNQKLLWETYC